MHSENGLFESITKNLLDLKSLSLGVFSEQNFTFRFRNILFKVMVQTNIVTQYQEESIQNCMKSLRILYKYAVYETQSKLIKHQNIIKFD